MNEETEVRARKLIQAVADELEARLYVLARDFGKVNLDSLEEEVGDFLVSLTAYKEENYKKVVKLLQEYVG